MTFTRGLGNILIRAAFRILIGPGNTDLLSGYRAFSRRYRAAVQLRSAGFEIETELATEAVARRLRVVEIPIAYHPRIAGTVSKLRAFRDGRRILLTIVIQSIRLRPYRLLLLSLAPALVLAAMVHWTFAAWILVGWIPLLALVESRSRRTDLLRSRRCDEFAARTIMSRYSASRPADGSPLVRHPATRTLIRNYQPMSYTFRRSGRRYSMTALIGLLIATGVAQSASGALPKVPDGFQIRLVAAVPAVQYPCQVATAPDGSLVRGRGPDGPGRVRRTSRSTGSCCSERARSRSSSPTS